MIGLPRIVPLPLCVGYLKLHIAEIEEFTGDRLDSRPITLQHCARFDELLIDEASALSILRQQPRSRVPIVVRARLCRIAGNLLSREATHQAKNDIRVNGWIVRHRPGRGLRGLVSPAWKETLAADVGAVSVLLESDHRTIGTQPF